MDVNIARRRYDIVLMVASKVGMKEMLNRFKKYVEKKKLVMKKQKLRTSKKMMEEERKKENIRRTCSGFTMQQNGKMERHTQDRIKRATIAMKKT